MRRNNIKSIVVNGVQVTNHSVKIQALTEHFRGIVGVPGNSIWHFSCDQLYQDLPKANDDLTGPFTEQEAVTAVRNMNRCSAPGPDGFGPSFYSATWHTVTEEVLGFLAAFYEDSLQLERVNRSHMVLIPKKADANTVDAFRPICLQNCCVKILSKILTTRLQTQIKKPVDLDQTGFIRGRSITENFVYAMELVQCCHKRKSPTLVIKLGFAKAFDRVNWDALDTVLQASFSTTWRRWMKHILQSSCSAVLVNGCQGRGLAVRRGLRQGDSISPYLFILVADLLHVLITKSQLVRHPIVEGKSCPVLQYTDYTLLLVNGELQDVQSLRMMLDQFASATGLINQLY